MPNDADDRGSPPPKRRKPAPPRPDLAAEGADEPEPTTWQPNPKRSQPAGTRNRDRWSPRNAAVPSAVAEIPKRGPSWWERILFGSVGTAQLAQFCRQFASYLDAGVDILKTLSNLETQFSRTALGPVLKRLTTAVRGGDSLAEAVAREPQAFDNLFLSMIRVAEARGGVPETLRRLADHYEARLSLIRQARAAAIYPIVVLVVAAGVIAMMTIWLLPMFVTLLKDIARPGTELPLPSRVLMAFSAFVGWIGWWLMPLLAVGLPFLGIWLYRTRGGKRAMDELALYIPVLGALLRKIDTTRFARTLSTLLDAGVDFGSSLDLTAGVMRLDPFRRAVLDARGQVIEGGLLSEALQRSHRFGPDVIAIIDSGEETGKLPETLNRLADDYEEQVEYMVRNMGQLIQPLLMIMLGGVVLFIILAVLLPYISILTNLAGGG
jgi:type II secretory pathway component PulF